MYGIYFLLFLAISSLFSCTRSVDRASDRVVALEVLHNEVSRADRLTAGDEIGVFAHLDGTEEYFLEQVKFVVGADGRSLSTSPAVYYPEAKPAVVFTAYLPFGGAWDGGVGTFSVPSDQTTAAALKQADLCWAKASSTPVAAPVALEFRHQMARLLITTNEPTEKIAIPNAFSGGILDIKTGTFTNTLRSEVFTTSNELILPAQTVTRLVLTVAGVEYTFEGAILLESGKTTSISLTLSPTQKSATLSNTNTSDWTISTRSGNPNSQIINQLKLHWMAPHADYAKADKVTLTIENPSTKATKNIDVTPTLIAGESSVAVCAYTLPVSLAAGSGFWYPYTVTRARIYHGATLLRDANAAAMRGGVIYRSGAQTLAINMYIQVRDAATNTTDVKEWLNVDKDFGSMLVRVTTVGCDNWTAVVEGGDGVNVQPSSGVSGAVMRINWSPNLTNAAKTNRVIKFYPTGVPTAFTPIATTQQAGPTTKAVLINGVYWATGNLIADGANGCKIGAPTDCGLYFQFGSLIGWSGGAAATGYDGRGAWSNHTATIKVRPSNLNPTYDPGSVWPIAGSTTTLDKSYFSVTSGVYSTKGTLIAGYVGAPTSGAGVDLTRRNLGEGRYAPMGVGDPCTSYLGAEWRLPILSDLYTSFGVAAPSQSITWRSVSKITLNSSVPRVVAAAGVSFMVVNSQWRHPNNGKVIDWDGVFIMLPRGDIASALTMEQIIFNAGYYYGTDAYRWQQLHIDGETTTYGDWQPGVTNGRIAGLVQRCVRLP